MDARINLFNGLELIIVHNAFGRGIPSSSREVVRQGESFQRQIFEEKGVSFPEKRVLHYEDSVGTPEEPGALDGSSFYHHLYLLREGKLVGMRASEEMELKGIGPVIIDYYPAMILDEEMRKNPQSMGLLFSAWADLQRPLDEYVAIFTDGLGMRESHLREYGFLKSAANVSVPALDAKTREEYEAVLDRIPMYARPVSKDANMLNLSKKGAEALLVAKYLKEGYIDNGQLRKLGLKVNELPCVVETRASITDAVKSQGYVAFRPF